MASTKKEGPRPKMAAEAWLWWGPVVLFVLTILPWDYGYYIFLRLAVTACSAAIAVKVWRDSGIWGPIFAASALLYNPIIRVSFDENIWTLINFVSAVLFIWHRRVYLKSLKS